MQTTATRERYSLTVEGHAMSIFQRGLVSIGLLIFSTGLLAGDQETGNLDWFGDFRLRLEQDLDSLNGDGTERDDRLRMRIRLRGGLSYSISDKWSATVAARSGPNLSQQSSHITIYDFDDGPDGPYEFNIDHWYLKYKTGGFEGWVGRNELSFWHQDDIFIFDNVTYPGMGASLKHASWNGSLTWHANLVALPVGMRDYSGTGLIGQAVYEREFNRSSFVVAAGYFGTRADPDDPDAGLLLTENGQRDYRIVNADFQYRSHAFGKPYRLGFNYSHNIKNYDNEPLDSFSYFHKKDRDAWVIEMEWDKLGASGNWLLAYYYSHLEALGRHSSYIQDDWVRWGNANQVRATNMKGSEFRAMYKPRPNMNILARLFFVDAINLLEPGDTTKETGNRFRIEWNVTF
jgi:hypothetical protein